MTLPLGVVLAGGLASRMGGGDKTLLPLGGAPILTHVLDRLAPQVSGLALNANGDPHRFSAFGLPVIADSIGGYAGPLAGVLAALDWAARNGGRSVVTVAGDTPFFPRDLVVRLEATAQGQDEPLVLAATADPRGEERTKSRSRSGLVRHPTFGLWPVALREELRRALADGLSKVVMFTERHAGREAVFPDPSAFFNINTPEDLAAARVRAR